LWAVCRIVQLVESIVLLGRNVCNCQAVCRNEMGS
jgi:hypothetical protein